MTQERWHQITRIYHAAREIGHARHGQRPVLVGFALETDSEAQAVQNARRKLAEKRVDVVVANQASEALEGDETRALLVDARDCRIIEKTSKQEAAGRILDFVVRLLGEKNA